MAGGGPKVTVFMAKITPRYKAGSRVWDSTWKVSSAPYHTPMHGTTFIRVTFALSRHLSRVTGVQKWLFLGSKSSHYGRLSPGHIVPPGKC